MRLYEVIKLSSNKKNPKIEEFMDTYFKVTQVHPLDPSSRIAWDGKSTATIVPMGNRIHISAVQTLAPGERSGSANGMIMTLVAIADETGIPLELIAKPFGDGPGKLTKPQLKAWYKRRGFVPTRADGMEYVPTVKESITEGISSVVYHYTSPQNALAMVKQNKIRLAAAAGTGSEATMQSGDRVYYLSTTRHKLGGYHLQSDSTGVIINLDGHKLGQRYKGKAVDYWGPDWYKDGAKGQHEREAEDRIFSTEPYIPDATKYIEAIHIMYTEKGQKWHERSGPSIRRLLIAAKTSGIPTFVYTDAKAWLVQNTRKAVNPNSIDPITKSSAKDIDRGYARRKQNDFSGWLELYYNDSEDRLTKNGDRYYTYVMNYPADGISNLANEIHNNKSNPDSGLSSLLRIMRKEKLTTPKEFVEFLRNKWEAIYKAKQ